MELYSRIIDTDEIRDILGNYEIEGLDDLTDAQIKETFDKYFDDNFVGRAFSETLSEVANGFEQDYA